MFRGGHQTFAAVFSHQLIGCGPLWASSRSEQKPSVHTMDKTHSVTYQQWRGENRENLSMTKARLEEFSVSLKWGIMRCGACRCTCAGSCQDKSGIRGPCGGEELSVSVVTGLRTFSQKGRMGSIKFPLIRDKCKPILGNISLSRAFNTFKTRESL